MSKTIRIAATSDLHGFLDGLEDELTKIKPDVFVIAGDIHPCRIDMDADKWFMETFFPFVEGQEIPVVAIPGNHDFWISDTLTYNYDWIMKSPPKNFHLLCDSEATFYGLRFYGTPWVPYINGRWCFEASNVTLKYQFSKIPKGVDVLITHSPPQMKHKFIDISIDRPKANWRHFGSQELTEAILEKFPHLLFCGHIHSGDHQCLEIRDREDNLITPCFNVARVNEQYNVAYPVQEVVVLKGEPLIKILHGENLIGDIDRTVRGS